MSDDIVLNYYDGQIEINDELYYLYSFTGEIRQIDFLFLSTYDPDLITTVSSNPIDFLVSVSEYPVSVSPDSDILIYFTGNKDDPVTINSSSGTQHIYTSNTTTAPYGTYFSGLGTIYLQNLYMSTQTINVQGMSEAYVAILLNSTNSPGKFTAYIYIVPNESFTNEGTFEFGPMKEGGRTYINNNIYVEWDSSKPFIETDPFQFNNIFTLVSQGQKSQIPRLRQYNYTYVSFLIPNNGNYLTSKVNMNKTILTKFDIQTKNGKYFYILFYVSCNGRIYNNQSVPTYYQAAMYEGNANETNISKLQMIDTLNAGNDSLVNIFPSFMKPYYTWNDITQPNLFNLYVMDSNNKYSPVSSEIVIPSNTELNCDILPNNGQQDLSMIANVYNFSISGIQPTINGVSCTLFFRTLLYPSNIDIVTVYLCAIINGQVNYLTPLVMNQSISNYASTSQTFEIDQPLIIEVNYGQNIALSSTYSLTMNGVQATINSMSNVPDGITGTQVESYLLPYNGMYLTGSFYWLFTSDQPITYNNTSYNMVILLFNSGLCISQLVAYMYIVPPSITDVKDLESNSVMTKRLCPGENHLSISGSSLGKLTWAADIEISNEMFIMSDNSFTSPDLTRQNITQDLPNNGIEYSCIRSLSDGDEQNFIIDSFVFEGSHNILVIKYVERNEISLACIYFFENIYESLCEGVNYKVSAYQKKCQYKSISLTWTGKIGSTLEETKRHIILQNSTLSKARRDYYSSTSDIVEALKKYGIPGLNISCSTDNNIISPEDSICSENMNLKYILIAVSTFFVIVIAAIILWFIFKK